MTIFEIHFIIFETKLLVGFCEMYMEYDKEV